MEDKLQFALKFLIFGLKSLGCPSKSKSNEKESESVLSEVERSFYESQFGNRFTIVQSKTH
jgi:SAM-dependent MidA family methyltransferase